MIAPSAFALLACAFLAATPPEDGLTQQFNRGDVFAETIDVRVVSPADAAASESQATTSYVIALETVTKEVLSSEEALLNSEVLRINAKTAIGGGEEFLTAYDSTIRRLVASTDDSTFDTDKLAELWSPFRGVTIERTAMTDGTVRHERTRDLPLTAREQLLDQAFADAFEQTLANSASWTLPAGPVSSWTDEAKWPASGRLIPVIRLYNYAGVTENNQDRIDVSMAATGPDGGARPVDPPLVGRGTIMFDRRVQRVTAVDLIIEVKQPTSTRTTIAWRLQPVATNELQ